MKTFIIAIFFLLNSPLLLAANNNQPHLNQPSSNIVMTNLIDEDFVNRNFLEIAHTHNLIDIYEDNDSTNCGFPIMLFSALGGYLLWNSYPLGWTSILLSVSLFYLSIKDSSRIALLEDIKNAIRNNDFSLLDKVLDETIKKIDYLYDETITKKAASLLITKVFLNENLRSTIKTTNDLIDAAVGLVSH